MVVSAPRLANVLDTFTLRVVFGLVAACVLVLFYAVTYRSTRSAFSGWWCVSLGLFVVAIVCFLGLRTPLQAVVLPLGEAVGVLGTGCTWAAARSLRGRGPAWRPTVAVALAVLLAVALDHPGESVWAGAEAYLLGMATMLGLSSYEAWAASAEVARQGEAAADVRPTMRSLAITSAAVTCYYVARTVVVATLGVEHPVFTMGFGPETTTVLTLLLLVVATFAMSTLSHAQQTSDLRRRATRDDLTGLFNRAEFLQAAERELARAGNGPVPVVVVADLDSFKVLNDNRGHAAGDAALRSFAEACEEVVGALGLVGRLGGDEFAVLTFGDRAADLATAIGRRLRERTDGACSASFGVAARQPGEGLADLMDRADGALYLAKAEGRDRVVLAATDPRLDPGLSASH